LEVGTLIDRKKAQGTRLRKPRICSAIQWESFST